MSLSLNTQRSIKSGKPSRRIGRGPGSGRGTYSGKGLKGQKSRSGGRGGLKLLGMKSQIQSMPKLPGFRSLKPKKIAVNLTVLEQNFENGDKVTALTLKEKGLIMNPDHGIKILGEGKLTKKLIIAANGVSATAQEAITKAGGKVILIGKKKVVSTKEQQ